MPFGILTDQAVDLLMQISTGQIRRAASEKYPAMAGQFGNIEIKRGAGQDKQVELGDAEVYRGGEGDVGEAEVLNQDMAIAEDDGIAGGGLRGGGKRGLKGRQPASVAKRQVHPDTVKLYTDMLKHGDSPEDLKHDLRPHTQEVLNKREYIPGGQDDADAKVI